MTMEQHYRETVRLLIVNPCVRLALFSPHRPESNLVFQDCRKTIKRSFVKNTPNIADIAIATTLALHEMAGGDVADTPGVARDDRFQAPAARGLQCLGEVLALIATAACC
jgi:hypothetical protein